MKTTNLWGESFDISSLEQEKTKKILKKAKNPTKVVTVEKQISSKTLPLKDKLVVIKENLLKILGEYKEQTQVIYTLEDYRNYINKALANGFISIDTETTSKDPMTAKIVGLVLHTDDMKQAYVPINHVDLNDKRLPNQLTEEQCREELEHAKKIKVIMHNGKFDYKVIKRTLNVVLPIYWDTMICAQLIDETKPAGLKELYRSLINPQQESYEFKTLFGEVSCKYIEPETFALYAASDGRLTTGLWKWQMDYFKNHEEFKNLYNLFRDVCTPLVTVLAEMELRGVKINKNYANRLLDKYQKKQAELEKQLADDFKQHQAVLDAWKLSKEANIKPKVEIKKEVYQKAVTKKNNLKDYVVEGNKYFKLGKSKLEQLSDPINFGSTTQLAIIIYDILKCGVVNKKKPRSVDKKTLPTLAKQNNLKFLNTLLEKKAVDTLLSDFIEKIPQMTSIDGRIHCNFNQLGEEESGVRTGRMSSSNPNLQQIPSKNKEIRLMFEATSEYIDNICIDNVYEVDSCAEAQLEDKSWKQVKNIKVGDRLLNSENKSDEVVEIIPKQNKYYLKVK